jgi:hypothetical protein
MAAKKYTIHYECWTNGCTKDDVRSNLHSITWFDANGKVDKLRRNEFTVLTSRQVYDYKNSKYRKLPPINKKQLSALKSIKGDRFTDVETTIIEPDGTISQMGKRIGRFDHWKE